MHERGEEEPDAGFFWGGEDAWLLPDDASGAMTGEPGVFLELAPDWFVAASTVTYADLDDDGFDDLVFSCEVFGDASAGGIVVVYGRGERLHGTVPIRTGDLLLFDVPGTSPPRSVDSGDFDGDGIDDLAISGSVPGPAGGFGVGRVRILYGDDARRTGMRSIVDVTASLVPDGEPPDAWPVRAGDLNHDGVDDLAVTTESTNGGVHLRIVEGRRDRWSGTSPLLDSTEIVTGFMGGTTSAWAAGDVDGDGHDDLLVASPSGPSTVVHVVYGPFVDRVVNVSPEAPAVQGVARFRTPAGGFDTNADGLADFALPLDDGSVVVIDGNRARASGNIDATRRTLLSAACATSEDGPGIAAGDVDGDGRSDLLVGSGLCSRVDLVFGTPHASSLAAADRTWLPMPVSDDEDGNVGFDIAQDGDFDGDGLADPVFAQNGRLSGVVLVYGARR